MALELENETAESSSALQTDVHVIALERLLERFGSNLNTGLADDTVAQHRAKYGENKLTPSRPPSLLWMFVQQLVIGFNSVLWLATLFAFLSYVSSVCVGIERCSARRL